MIRRGIGVQSFVSAGGGTDADAQAVITAIESTGVTLTATQKTACNTLVTDLKGYGIWSKLKAVYGFLGGTAGAHKWNWKNPADTDAAFRLVFFGGLTHSSAGITGNGTNGYFDTFLNDNTTLQLNDVHASAYSSSNIARATDVLFSTVELANNAIFLNPRNSTDIFGSRLHNTNLGNISNTNSTGFYAVNRISSASYSAIKNNTATTINETSTSKQNDKILGLVAGTIYSQRNISWMSIGDGLTTTEAANLYTAVQAYQTTLSRNV